MTTSIGFHPALPCCTVRGDTRCGKDATAGTLYPIAGGNWILQPFCRECTQALLKVYGGPEGELFPPTAESPVERHTRRAIGLIKQMREREPSEDDRSGWLNMSNGEEIP